MTLCIAPLALAQNCGSGGGATVCLSATGSASDIQLTWTVSGNISSVQIYRDTDSNPSGRIRVATPTVGTRSYSDSSAVAGTQYWYWVKFTASGSSYNSGAATAVRASGMRNITSLQLAPQMSPGWNLGNSLEAIGGETAWGNPAVNQAMFNAVKAAGFKSVRIPVSWTQYADSNYTISASWMARVKQVVDYARNAGLYVMINVHWDGGWMQPTYAQQTSANNRLRTFWTQIANTFKGYDDYLLFAGTNETMVDGNYGAPTSEYCSVQNSFLKTFVDAVRATGGNNAVRHLVVQGFNTNIDYTIGCNATLPADKVANRLMMEVHFYDPYNFTLNTNSSIWQWGATATSPANTETWANEAFVDAQFQKMKTNFIDKGIPVILGEYAASAKFEYDPSGNYRKKWDQYITRSAYLHGLVPVYWDAGFTGNHGSGLFERSSATQAYPDIISVIVNAAK
ncbi:MAG: glycoside hydrolase family 5 protein [Gammaproteobacteria bacterium]